MIKQINNLLIRHEEGDKDYIQNFDIELFKKEYEKIKSFFNFPRDLPTIKICFLYSPAEYNFFTGDIHDQKWKCAMAGVNTTIYIFAPSVIEKYTIHKKEEIFSTIIHELSHLFYGYSRLFNLPFINEGIANYFKKGFSKEKLEFELNSLKHGKEPKYDYIFGHLLISCVIKQLGEKEAGEKLLKFLKSIIPDDSEEKLFEKFENVFAMNPNKIIEIQGGKK